MPDQNNFFSIPKAAEQCGVDRRTMWRWVKSGRVNSFVTPGGHHRILRSDIDSLLAKTGLPVTSPQDEKSILIVDDDESVRTTFQKRLIRKKFRVSTAADGFQAGLKVRDLKPDLIVLDLMMEGIDGFEVCRLIKEDPSLKDSKILVMTGFDTPENRKRALAEGADAYLPKSADFQTLLTHIQALLAK